MSAEQVERGHARLAAALRADDPLEQVEREALTELLGAVGIADGLVRTGTVELPVLAGYLLAVVDAYRGALSVLGGAQ